MAYDTYKINYNNQNLCVSYYTGCQLSNVKKFKSTVNKIPFKFLSLTFILLSYLIKFCFLLWKASYQQKHKHYVVVCTTISGISSANLWWFGSERIHCSM